MTTKCPHCNQPVEIPDGETEAVCRYCDQHVEIPEEVVERDDGTVSCGDGVAYYGGMGRL
jgi:primosomal protein N'